jgi:hypothetical protein
MPEKFLKARVSTELYQTLLARAGESGKRLGTFVREALERDAQAVTTTQVLERIEAALANPAAMTATAPAPKAPADHELRRELNEVRLLVRELAMQTNAQIVARVAAQIAAQTPQINR